MGTPVALREWEASPLPSGQFWRRHGEGNGREDEAGLHFPGLTAQQEVWGDALVMTGHRGKRTIWKRAVALPEGSRKSDAHEEGNLTLMLSTVA